MVLMQPIWLLLLIPLGWAWWRWSGPTPIVSALRALLLGLVVWVMCEPVLRLPERAGTVVVVADRSRSMPADTDALQREAIDLLQRASGPRDRLAVVSFGARVAVERPPDVGTFEGFSQSIGPDGSNLGEAIERALSLVPAGESARLLVLSDGLWTGRDPQRAAVRAAGSDVPIDYRLIARGRANDVAIERIETVRRVTEGEAFMMHAWVRSPRAQRIAYALERDGQRLSAGERQIGAGLTRLTFRDRAESIGVRRYALRVAPPEDDPMPENNHARWLVDVAGPRPVLLASETEAPTLAQLLQRDGLDIERAAPGAIDWSLASLEGYTAVVLENVPARRVPSDAMRTLGAWVQRHGGGLVMTGGARSFGPGGYFDSPLAPVLPVSMELRQEHRKLSMAVAVTLDRSGSMQMSVGGGRTKMELANLGTARVLDMLTPLDEFGVLAVDTRPHVIAPMQRVPSDPDALRERLLRMESTGGGIYIYEALTAAYEMLQESDAGTRHLILFSDAADSVRPGRYRELLETYEREGITVSVIGLGTRADKDAALLEDIARRGGGRFFVTNDPHRLPELFAEDMVVVERSAFIREPTPVRATAALSVMVGRALPEPPAVGGYNLTYLRDGATPAMLTADEYTAPLLATWQAGRGRAAVYTGEADGQHTGAIAQWPAIGEVLGSTVRWTAGEAEALPETMMLRQQLERGVYRVALELDPHRPDAMLRQPPTVHTLHEQVEGDPTARRTPMRWETTDRLVAEVDLDAAGAVLTRVDVPGHGSLRLAPVMLPYSPEFAPLEHDGEDALRRLARVSGGEQRVNLASLWSALDRTARYRSISHWLLIAATLVLLAEVLERRTGALGRLVRVGRIARSRSAAARDTGAPMPRIPEVSEAGGSSASSSIDEARDEPNRTANVGGGLADALTQARNRAAGRYDRQR